MDRERKDGERDCEREREREGVEYKTNVTAKPGQTVNTRGCLLLVCCCLPLHDVIRQRGMRKMRRGERRTGIEIGFAGN